MKTKTAYSSQELSALLRVTRQAIELRAARENWQSVPRPGRGGGRLWLLTSMPEATRREVAAALAVEAPTHDDALQASLGQLAELPPSRRQRAEVRASLARMAQAFVGACGLSQTAALRLFCESYNTGGLDAPDHVRAAVPHVSLNSLKAWMDNLQRAGIASLAGDYGKRAGSGLIDSQPAVLELVLGELYDDPDISGELLYQGIKTRFKGDSAITVPSLRRVQAWLRKWKEGNAQLYTYIAAPDQWRNEFMASCGNAAERIIRPNQRWEFDGTPSDLILADGRRYNITGVIDVYTRRLMLLVSERASSRAVASLTRRALLEWGVPETPVTDNGKDYVADHMKQLWAGLGITPVTLPPFRPDLKPFIERSFRTFSHHLLTMLPGYTGANVAERQRIRDRRSFAQRLMKQGEDIELPLDKQQLQEFCDDWCNAVYAHKPHKGLRGKTPFAMAASLDPANIRRIKDERALDILLLPLAPGSQGWRTVGKKGLRAANRTFDAPELGGLEGKLLQVRLDDTDAGVAYLFDEENHFVCRAVDHDVLGVGLDEIAAKRREHQKKAMREASAVMRRASRAANVKNLAREIMDDAKTRAARLHTLPGQSPAYATAGLAEAGRAAMSRDGLPGLTPERARELRDMARTAMSGAGFRAPETSAARYRVCRQILAAVESGQAVTAEERNWAYNYRASSEYVGHETMARMFADNATGAAVTAG